MDYDRELPLRIVSVNGCVYIACWVQGCSWDIQSGEPKALKLATEHVAHVHGRAREVLERWPISNH